MSIKLIYNNMCIFLWNMNNRSYIGYSNIFHLDNNDREYNKYELSDEIIVNERVFNELVREFDDESVLFMYLIHKRTMISYLVTLGAPHKNRDDMVFIPEWIMDYMGCSIEDEPEFRIEKATNELSVAKKIKIKLVDMDLDGEIDLCGYFERALMNLHSIQEGVTLPIYIEELGENIVAYIDKVEPSVCSRIITGEVEVEFISTTEESISSSSSLGSSFDSSISSSSPMSTIQVPPNTPFLSPSSSLSSSDSQPFSLSSDTDEKYNLQDTFCERQQKIRDSWVKRFSS